ncbi:MAG: class I SAM-dependent rRNA methyltransferase [Chitinophagales bacterium]|nr:class I SAM-dependent rRNA methyltransferase [Chitinophagales bacterium]MDW8428012.1 class I SAM-dependent rRNA methyltransferase [Chitinophagales bacterium]
MPQPVLRLRNKKLSRIRSGHPWIYDNELDADTFKELEPGTTVTVVDHQNRFIGQGYVNPRSKITVRLLTRDSDAVIDIPFFRQQIIKSLNYRKRIGYSGSFRLIHSEGDDLPGLTVDCFEDVFVIQTLTAGMDRWKAAIGHILHELFRPRGIYERNEAPVRALEGLPLQSGFLFDPFDTLVKIQLPDASFYVDVAQGQKTGFYLDQRENRLALKHLAHEADVLDCFCHTGAFSIYAARYGARHVLACDTSAEALTLARSNAALNQCADRITFLEKNAFDLLPELVAQKQRFDLIVLDPPAFTKSRQGIAPAISGYREINLRAFKLLRPGGFLFTFSCSHFIDEPLFRKTVAEAAADAGCQVRQLQVLQQAKDHPVCWYIPETFYLKGLILQVL